MNYYSQTGFDPLEPPRIRSSRLFPNPPSRLVPFLFVVSLSLSLGSPLLSSLLVSLVLSLFLSVSLSRLYPPSGGRRVLSPTTRAVPLRSPRYKWQSKLRHYEVPWTEVTPPRSHHFGSTNATATLGRSPHLESRERKGPPPTPGRQLSSFMAAQEGHQNLLRRCPNWYSVLKEEKIYKLELFRR